MTKIRFFSIVAAFSLCFATGSMTKAQTIIASGECGANGNNLTWVLTSDSVLTISGSGAMVDLWFFESTPWYPHIERIKTVIIGNGATTIGGIAFQYCTNLTTITIPNSVTSIGSNSFRSCNSLVEITIPNLVTSIGNGAFAFCSSLTEITIPNLVTSIEEYALTACTNLTTINFNATNCTNIGNIWLNGCTSLTTLNIGNNVHTITDQAFNSSNLKIVNIGNSVRAISIGAFRNCSNLTTLNFNAINCTDIHDAWLYGCTSLITVNIENDVQIIPNDAFRYRPSLTSLSIGNSVIKIGKFAFNGANLNSITSYSYTPPAIEQYTFLGVSNTIPIHVPCGYETDYKTANYWNEFTNYTDCVGIDEVEFDKRNIKVYPNPTTGELRIENSDLQIDNVQIFDIVGKLVLSSTASSQSQETVINIAHLTNGIYFVKLKTDKGELTKKVIKE